MDPLVDDRFAQAAGRAAPVGTPIRVPVRFQPTDLVIPKGGTVRLTIAGTLIVAGGVESALSLATMGQMELPSIVEDPSAPSLSLKTVTILHDCEHPNALRFVLPQGFPSS